MNILKQQIEQRLKAKSLSIQALEKKAGLKVSAVRNILNGSSKKPNVFSLHSIAQALDCSILDLMGESSSKAPTLEAFSSEDKIWNEALFKETADIVDKLYKKRKHTPFSREALFIIKEIYYYSLNNNNPKVDQNFAEWLINKNLPESL